VRLAGDGATFGVWSGAAERVDLCLFDKSGQVETARIAMTRRPDGLFAATVPGIGAGALYGYRADGAYEPSQGVWFDPAKLLMDPYAERIDRPYVYDPRLAAPREAGIDTAPLMPKAVVCEPLADLPVAPVSFRPGGLVYELSVRAFTMRHPSVPEADRGTLRALAHPEIIAHLKRIGVSAVELMPVTAWIDERHLGPLGLTNAWGYNPVSFMALDPRLAPDGLADLRTVVGTLRAEGLGVILDLVFNHTGESDREGPTLSLRGLDSQAYYRHLPDDPGVLVNDTGTGNTLACDRPVVRRLVLDALRHFVLRAGVDGFRFDLGTVLGRTASGFEAEGGLLADIRDDAVLGGRVLIAEPWDIGPGGYQLGRFPRPYLEWNDRYRDDMRRFWRGDAGTVGALATRLAGSFDVFEGGAATRSVGFLAAHDGFALADLVRYERKHNEANGEDNRDGHNENLSWNNGVEGETDDARVDAARGQDLRALLTTLFVSRGTIMLTAGDEFGRTQKGNNNAYCQDNDITWLDWTARDTGLEDHVATLARMRADLAVLRDGERLTGGPANGLMPDVVWLTETGVPMAEADWQDPHRHRLTMVLSGPDGARVAVVVNADRRPVMTTVPSLPGRRWRGRIGGIDLGDDGTAVVPGRSCLCFEEVAA
jgi:glycogen operon protein